MMLPGFLFGEIQARRPQLTDTAMPISWPLVNQRPRAKLDGEKCLVYLMKVMMMQDEQQREEERKAREKQRHANQRRHYHMMEMMMMMIMTGKYPAKRRSTSHSDDSK